MEAKETPSKSVLGPRRRLRGAKSCMPCRKRKTKCDGASPCCGMCKARGVSARDCVYETLAEKRARETRIRDLSARDTDAATTTTTGEGSSATTPSAKSQHSASKLSQTQQNIVNESIQPSYLDGNNQAPHHPLQQTIQPCSQQPQDDAVFGLWSTNSFIRKTMAAIDPEGEQKPKKVHGSSMLDAAGFSTMLANDVHHSMETLSLPGRAIADSMIQTYWHHVHPIFPILHRPTFAPQFESLWQSRSSPQEGASSNGRKQISEQTILLQAIVNVVLAIGCQRCEDIPSDLKARDAETLYKRSVQLVSVESLDFYSLEVMQLLLLRAVYLQYTPFASRCWSTLGVALRAAQGIGLHVDQPNRSQLDREMRRRIWHGFILLESIGSVMFGWPVTTFTGERVPKPLPIDDEYLSNDQEGEQPPGKPSYMELYLCYVQFCDFFTPDRVNVTHPFCLQPTDQRSLMDLMQYLSGVPKRNLELEHLLECLPLCLKQPDDYTKLDPRFRTHHHFIKTRVLYGQVNMMRPCMIASILSRFQPSLQSLQESPLARNLMTEINLLCVRTACNILNECYTQFHLFYRPMTWQLLRVTFGSASLLLAATALPDLHVDLSVGAYSQAWDQAIGIFDMYMTHDSTAQSAKMALLEYRYKFQAALHKCNMAGYRMDDQAGGEGGTYQQQPHEFTQLLGSSTSVPFAGTGMGVDMHMQGDFRGVDDFLNLNIFDWC